MSSECVRSLDARVAAVAQAALVQQHYVSPLDVLTGLGWLPENLVADWRAGRVDCCQDLLSVRPDTLAAAMVYLRQWATGKGLHPTEAVYARATRDRRALRFTSRGSERAEREYHTHWVSPDLPQSRREELSATRNKAPDLVVIAALNDWACASCSGSGDFLVMDDAGPLCLTCVDLDHLVFLAAGNAALSRRARKASGLVAVVVRFNRSRKRYERQGILVEEAALDQAEASCLADEDARERRRVRERARRADQDLDFQASFATEIVRLFPGCRAERAEAIAHHAGIRGSGRVGRSAAGRALDHEAVTLAVIASVRHEDTDYDTLLMSGMSRQDARDKIRGELDRVLDRWRAPR